MLLRQEARSLDPTFNLIPALLTSWTATTLDHVSPTRYGSQPGSDRVCRECYGRCCENHFKARRADQFALQGNLDERCTDALIWELMLQAGPIGTQ